MGKPGDLFTLRCLVAAFSCAAATALASAPLEWTWASWVCLAPLLRVLSGQSVRRSFWIGWSGGAGANLALFTWLGLAFRDYGALHPVVAALLFVVFVGACGLQYALLGVVDAWVRVHWKRARLALFPCAFVAVELLWPRPFPWHLSTPQVVHPLLIQTAEWGGQLVLTYVLVSVNCGLYALLRWRLRRRGLVPVGWALGLVVLTAVYGAIRLNSVKAALDAAPSRVVAIVQPNAIRNRFAQLEPHVVQAALERGARAASAGGVPWLTVFSEGALPERILKVETRGAGFERMEAQLLFEARQAERQLARVAQATRGPILIGANLREYQATSATEAEVTAFRNVLLLVEASGQISDRYDKHVLLPFAEYLPGEASVSALRDLVPFAGRMTSGEGPKLLTVDGVTVAPLICYEGVLSDVVRGAFQPVAPDVLINATNDVWFSGQGPHLHRMIVLWRAVETRRPLIRVTSTGLSAVAFPDGTLHGEIGLGREETTRVDLPLADLPVTAYVRTGDRFAWLLTLAACAALGIRRSWFGKRPSAPAS